MKNSNVFFRLKYAAKALPAILFAPAILIAPTVYVPVYSSLNTIPVHQTNWAFHLPTSVPDQLLVASHLNVPLLDRLDIYLSIHETD
jgi:hypothetical protein